MKFYFTALMTVLLIGNFGLAADDQSLLTEQSSFDWSELTDDEFNEIEVYASRLSRRWYCVAKASIWKYKAYGRSKVSAKFAARKLCNDNKPSPYSFCSIEKCKKRN